MGACYASRTSGRAMTPGATHVRPHCVCPATHHTRPPAALLENAAQAYARGEYSVAYKNWTAAIDLGEAGTWPCRGRAADSGGDRDDGGVAWSDAVLSRRNLGAGTIRGKLKAEHAENTPPPAAAAAPRLLPRSRP
jgi:hypothetical protein